MRNIPDCKLEHHRTYRSIHLYAFRLGLNFVSYFNNFSNEEDEILKLYYPIEGKAVLNRLKNRTYEQIATRVIQLKLHHGRGWTSYEDSILNSYAKTNKLFFTKADLVLLEKELKRSKGAIMRRLSELGLRKDFSWSKEEDDILIKFYPSLGIKVGEKLVGRSKGAILNRALYLNLKKDMIVTCNKRVQCIETGEIFSSATATGFRHVGECCKNSNKTAGGYHWRYVDEAQENTSSN